MWLGSFDGLAVRMARGGGCWPLLSASRCERRDFVHGLGASVGRTGVIDRRHHTLRGPAGTRHGGASVGRTGLRRRVRRIAAMIQAQQELLDALQKAVAET